MSLREQEYDKCSSLQIAIAYPHCEQEFDLEYMSKGYYATIHSPATCPRDLRVRLWLHGQSGRREASA